uniref:Secreted protein n=1 Tax=Arundo donax TaxID=35708 RepID=A0A0A9BNR0_ARUDO
MLMISAGGSKILRILNCLHVVLFFSSVRRATYLSIMREQNCIQKLYPTDCPILPYYRTLGLFFLNKHCSGFLF